MREVVVREAVCEGGGVEREVMCEGGGMCEGGM